ncbi:MAG: prepilin-type N-terminal cleavage/methylation domain-containing protein [Sulfuricurvum sp.]|nr:prepilin-type N-terminal cleavage/methylation domain-containing protein [Sulfuricurvum sp.]
MKRSGFTMIELIFVIVILGILAAVALPKFIGVSEQAQVSKLKAYVGTLNRTVSPALWSKSISNGNGGKVALTAFDADLVASLPPLESLDDNGKALAITSLNAKCAVNSAAALSAAVPGTTTMTSAGDVNSSITIGGNAYSIGCIDGNMSSAPQFYLLDSTKKLIVK